VLLATVLFRWFNRIVSGEAIFQQARSNFVEQAQPGETAWDELLRTGSTEGLRDSLVCWCGEGPYVTGSYIIKTPNGMSKLDGVLDCVEKFMLQKHLHVDQCSTQSEVAQYLLDHRGEVRLHDVWAWLREFPYLGDFMAYEVVTDLRHTDLLDHAPDIMTWANPGPGAMRGLNRIVGRRLDERIPRELANKEMRMLLEYSTRAAHWPQFRRLSHNTVEARYPGGDLMYDMVRIDSEGQECWPSWEMRDVEHTLCEFDKYERARLGQGRPRQVLR
jgi:hypothetical protein